MSVWREVQETLLQRFVAAWIDVNGDPLTEVFLENEPIDPPNGPWALVTVQRRASSPGTLGRRGNRRVDRRGAVFVSLRVVPGKGTGDLSDLGERAGRVFEGCRFEPHDIRCGIADPGVAGFVDQSRWWGVSVEAPFDYEDWN